jgi:hypothetical protein
MSYSKTNFSLHQSETIHRFAITTGAGFKLSPDNHQESFGYRHWNRHLGNVRPLALCNNARFRDFADEFPSAEVIATDISPIQPKWVPPNLRFEMDDAQLEWTRPPDSYDFIHIRGLLGCMSDWPALYSRAFRTIKPGGWLENIEMDMRFKFDNCNVSSEHILFNWATPFVVSGDKIGTTFDVAGKMKGWMEHAGFVNVAEKSYKIPFSGESRLTQWNEYFYSFDLLRRVCIVGFDRTDEGVLSFRYSCLLLLMTGYSGPIQQFRYT